MLTGGAFRDALMLRSGGLCECCAQPLDHRWEAHHRLPGGMGGSRRPERHTVANGLALKSTCHNMTPTSVHVSSIRARALGYLISQADAREPSAIPVYLHARRWVLLDVNGLYVPTEQPEYAADFVAA